LDDVTSTSTSGGTWFQTGKSYDTEVSQYSRNRVSGEEMQLQRSSGIGDIGEQGFRDRDEAVPDVASSNGGYYVQDGNGHAVEEAVGHDNNIPLMMMGEDSVSSSSSSTTSSGGSRSALTSWVVLCGGGLVAVAYSLL